jgi:hypothetical protein
VVAVLAALVASRVGGTRIAGRAIAPAGLGAPSVGECVRSFTDPAAAAPPVQEFDAARDPRTSAGRAALPAVGVVGEPDVTFTDCSGNHLAEVVAYRRMPRQVASDADRGADVDWCRSVARDYLAHVQWWVNDAAGGTWLASTGQRFTAVLSAPFILADEPRWSACLVLPPAGESYRGSYLRSLAFEPAPAPFGRCFDRVLPRVPVSCAQPHNVQEFGVSSGRPTVAEESAARCRDLIEAMTGMDDISEGGRLRVDVYSEAAPGGATSCRLSVVGDGRLTGTLIGIGTAPLPWR